MIRADSLKVMVVRGVDQARTHLEVVLAFTERAFRRRRVGGLGH